MPSEPADPPPHNHYSYPLPTLLPRLARLLVAFEFARRPCPLRGYRARARASVGLGLQ